jgi:Na+/proline symporter
MDSALNKNSGIFIRSIYQPFLAKRNKIVDDVHLLKMGKILSFINGLLVIVMALFFKSLKELSLFDLMMSFSVMIQVPILIPLIFGLFIKKTPNWAPWVTVIVGLFVSWFVMNIMTPDVFSTFIGINKFTPREASDMNLILTIGAHLVITAGFFCSTALFYKEEKDPYREQTDAFFKDIITPVIADNEQDDYDRQQRNKLGLMVMYMGTGIVLMVFIPNPWWGRLLFLSCALIILATGFLLKKSAKTKQITI